MLLLAIGVPWYWGWLPGLASALVWGMPAWGAVSLAASVGASIWTVVLLQRRWPDELQSRDEECR